MPLVDHAEPVPPVIPDQPEDDVLKIQPKKLVRILVITLVFIVTGLTLMYVFRGRMFQSSLPSQVLEQLEPVQQIAQTVWEETVPSATPFPLEELTIPYLRNREYVSELAIVEQVGTNANYTSSIASYDSDGLRLRGLLTQPAGVQPDGGWPAIIFLHGYIPPAEYSTTVNYASYVDYFARNGFVVFKIDLRGHDQSEGEAGGAYYSSDYVIDTLNARAALQKSGFVHPDKIGLWGHSMAGNVVMRSLVVEPEIPAAVIWAGAGYTYADIQEYGIDDNSYRAPPQNTERARKRNEMRERYGEFDTNHWFWQLVTPANYFDDIGAAIQVHHAVDDSVVSVEYARNLMNLLGATSVDHKLFEYQSGGHNLTGASFTQAMQRGVEFFREKLR